MRWGVSKSSEIEAANGEHLLENGSPNSTRTMLQSQERSSGDNVGHDAGLGVACFALRAEIVDVDEEDLKEGFVRLLAG
jgi:hypothetical protein